LLNNDCPRAARRDPISAPPLIMRPAKHFLMRQHRQARLFNLLAQYLKYDLFRSIPRSLEAIRVLFSAPIFGLHQCHPWSSFSGLHLSDQTLFLSRAVELYPLRPLPTPLPRESTAPAVLPVPPRPLLETPFPETPRHADVHIRSPFLGDASCGKWWGPPSTSWGGSASQVRSIVWIGLMTVGIH
jgi:hypothetical protein